MITLKKLQEIQLDFDSSHAGRRPWYSAASDDNPEVLEHTALCLAGEVGELANIIKKVSRGDLGYSEARALIAEEIADVFAYTLKIANQVGLSVEEVYMEKMAINAEKFKKYEIR